MFINPTKPWILVDSWTNPNIWTKDLRKIRQWCTDIGLKCKQKIPFFTLDSLPMRLGTGQHCCDCSQWQPLEMSLFVQHLWTTLSWTRTKHEVNYQTSLSGDLKSIQVCLLFSFFSLHQRLLIIYSHLWSPCCNNDQPTRLAMALESVAAKQPM